MKCLEIGGWDYPVQHPGAEMLRADTVERGGLVFTWGTESIPLADSSLHGVYANHVLEHVEWWNIKRALSEVYRVLKPGGFFEVHVPDTFKALKLWERGEVPTNRACCDDQIDAVNAVVCWGSPRVESGRLEHWHKSIWTPTMLEDRLRAAGFKEIDAAPPLPPHNRPQSRWYDLGYRCIK